jgi:tetratricopeptide (TPR) repeat protein
VTYARLAGAAALQRWANREAVAHLERALEALGHLPESRETLEAAVDLRFDLRSALFPLGEYARLGACLREAEALAARLGDLPRLGRAASYLTSHALAVGDHEGAIAAGGRALDIAERLGDADLQLTTQFRLGQLYANLGDYRRAAEVNRRTVELVEAMPAREGVASSAPALLSQTWLAWCLAELGEFPEALARAEHRLEVAEARADPFECLTAALGLGLVQLRRGALGEAIEVLHRALEPARSGLLAVWFPAVASPLGYAYALAGRPEEAVVHLEAAVQETLLRSAGGHAGRMAHLGEAYLLAGRREEAGRIAQRALALARERSEGGHEAYVRRRKATAVIGSGTIGPAR